MEIHSNRIEELKKLYLLGWLILWTSAVNAQISHGGEPLPLSTLRNSEDIPFVEMPSFDIAEEIRLDSLMESDLRNGFRFAYKFITDLKRSNSGISFILPDGTKVWRVGIYSPGALSLNLLFNEYELPEGARVFLYDEQQQHILGAFTHQNNSERAILPVAPITGDRIIVEYQEPAQAEFPGRLTIGEVNHAYRSLKGKEPQEGYTNIDGIPALSCYADTSSQIQTWGRSVVLMIINGTTACTGTLLNNTAQDGKPYLLTASHCLNKNFSIQNPDYEEIAGNIICFYNYNSPLCDPILRGTEELSTASAHSRAVYEFTDMALLELEEMPPIYYQPYLAGWNIGNKGNSPYYCIQHPEYSTKRISIYNGELTSYSMIDAAMVFCPNGHWLVKEWNIGYTASGSSGSPLFDQTGKVVGALSGGQSSKSSPRNDYFYSIQKSWDLSSNKDSQLKYWLDPRSSSATECEGLDPYASAPCFRLSNVQESGKKEAIEVTKRNGEPLFGNNSSGNSEYAEAYTIAGPALLYGVYIVTPPCEANEIPEVEITVYEGETAPYTLLYKETFKPAYQNQTSEGTFIETSKDLNRSQESFITFDAPIPVKNKFYVGYRIKQISEGAYFSAYNLPSGTVSGNTAWVLTENEWIPANQYTPIGFNTSLFIDPVINYTSVTANEKITSSIPIRIFQSHDRQWLHILLDEGLQKIDKGGYQIFSTNGQLVKSGSLSIGNNPISLAELPPGLFIVRTTTGKYQESRKIIH